MHLLFKIKNLYVLDLKNFEYKKCSISQQKLPLPRKLLGWYCLKVEFSGNILTIITFFIQSKCHKLRRFSAKIVENIFVLCYRINILIIK